MKHVLTAVLLPAFLAGCGGSNPFAAEDDAGAEIVPSVTGLPGTVNATAADTLYRYEDNQGGFGDVPDSYTYVPGSDSFLVDQLPFDGAGIYDRDNEVATLTTGVKVYENNNAAPARKYKLIYDSSASGQSQYVIVRTGDYREFGYGGFIYQRSGSVTLPTTGDAVYTGAYAGIRVFNDTDGLQYVTGDATLEIDFEDFDLERAFEGRVETRQVFDTDGSLAAVQTDVGDLTLATGAISDAGEATGTVFLDDIPRVNQSGDNKYYAVLSGDSATEVVGIILIESGNYQETGGFNLTTP
jgi:hypothetical protein